MKLVLLPGNSKHNKDWIKLVEKTLQPLFSETKIVYYDHWEKEDGMIDLEREEKKLVEIAGEDKVVLFAKSAGTVVAMRCLRNNRIKAEACIFLGIPSGWSGTNLEELKDLLGSLDCRTLFIQEKEDKYGSAKELEDLLIQNGVKNYKLVVVPGKDHRYPHIEQIKQLVEAFV